MLSTSRYNEPKKRTRRMALGSNSGIKLTKVEEQNAAELGNRKELEARKCWASWIRTQSESRPNYCSVLLWASLPCLNFVLHPLWYYVAIIEVVLGLLQQDQQRRNFVLNNSSWAHIQAAAPAVFVRVSCVFSWLVATVSFLQLASARVILLSGNLKLVLDTQQHH